MSAAGEFVRGAGLLGRGFGYWPKRTGTMALGLVPAAIVGVLFLAGLIALAVSLPGITEALTPYARSWPGVWITVIRIAVGTALVGAALVMVAVSFTALTLLIGEPFYDRIWRAVEADLGEAALDGDLGLRHAVAGSVSLVARGAAVALAAALLGLVPIVGGIVSAIFAVTATGWLLSDELTSRALDARGIPSRGRRDLLRRHRSRVLGFGVATQLCFLVPGGAIATMPGAVAGSTVLARSLLEETGD